eukprot:c15272_g1_i1.p1 GENE.c15272_g1_i1~~c15272_g1_i1.p1  ORF type:complete len:587 (+),score=182.89 c15272_g1_i1:89-1762(+)
MKLVHAVKEYIMRMITDISGMKVMLFDKETSGIVSMVLSQSEILEKDVFLTELLESHQRERMTHLKAVIFVRPDPSNIALIRQELREPHYGEYHIFFSNIVKTNYLEDIAHSDEHEVVRQVQEFFADFFAVSNTLFSLNIPALTPTLTRVSVSETERIVEGVTAVLLALKKQPQIRFQKNSTATENLAKQIAQRMDRERELFHMARRPADMPPLLLILDRRDDPVTPLLSQWTYRAMVHELVGIHNHRVSLKDAPGLRKDMQEIVLAPHQDDFYRTNVNTNFGDLGINVKQLVDEYQAKHKSHQNIESIADMQKFVEAYPEFRKLAGNVTKHVTVLSELSRLVEVGHLMDVSMVEQQLACAENHQEAVKQVQDIIGNPHIPMVNKLRVVMLYALRYEDKGNPNLSGMLDVLRECGAQQHQLQMVNDLLDYAGTSKRGADLFQNKNLLVALKKSMQRELTGVSNVYTQHKPLLDSILESIAKNRLNPNLYPSLTDPSRERPQDVIVFVLGGATYEEAACVEEFNKLNAGMRVVLGGTHVHNSASFLSGLKQVTGMADL